MLTRCLLVLFLMPWLTAGETRASTPDAKSKKTEESAKTEDTAETRLQKEKEAFLALFPDYLQKPAELYFAGDYQKSLQILKKRKKQSTDRYQDRYHLLSGLNSHKLGLTEAAHSQFSKSAALRRSNSDTLFHLAQTELTLGNPKVAVQLLEEALWFEKFSILSPEEAPLLLAKIYRSAGQDKRVEEYLTLARSKSPSSPRANRKLAENFLEMGEKPQALSYSRKALELDKEDPLSKLMLAKVLLHTPDRILGAQDIMEAKEITSQLLNNEELEAEHRKEAFALFIRSLIENEELDAAASNLTTAKKEFPDDAELDGLLVQLDIEKKALAAKKAPGPSAESS